MSIYTIYLYYFNFYRSIYISEIEQQNLPHFIFLDMICRCKRGIYDRPFGGLVVYLDGDFLQSVGWFAKFKNYNKTYGFPLFFGDVFKEEFWTVFFPEEFNKRFKDEEHRQFIMDLRLRICTDKQVQYWKANVGKNIENLYGIRNSMNIVDGFLIRKNPHKNLHADSQQDRDIVDHRLNVCWQSSNGLYLGYGYKFPINILGGVSLMCTERLQLAEYQNSYRLGLNTYSNSNKNNVFSSKTAVVFFDVNHKLVYTKLLTTLTNELDALRRYVQGFTEVENQLPDENIIIIEGSNYSICVNTKADQLYRHDIVKVLKIDQIKGEVKTKIFCFISQ